MSRIKQPYVSITKQSAGLPVGLDSQKILIIGQKASSGTAIEKTLYTSLEESQILDLFGKNSSLSTTLRAMFDELEQAPSPYLPRIDVIALEDAGGATKASATITLAASGGDDTANKTGTVTLNLCGEEIDIDITTGDDLSTSIAPAIVASINLLDLPLTASDDGAGVVTIEFVNGGTLNNKATIKLDGLTKVSTDYFFSNIQFTLSPVSSNTGATDPTLTDLLDVVDKIRYQSMSYPVEYGTDLATDFLDTRFNVANAIKDGVAILKNTDSYADLAIVLDALKSQSLVYYCNKETAVDLFDGGEDLELDYVAAARVATIRALRLTENANIVNITPANVAGTNDALGGKHIASLPYFNTPVSGSPIQPEGKGWTDAQVELLLGKGGCIMGNNTASNAIILNEIVTTYKTDTAGNVDVTWKFLNTVDTMSASAEYMFNNLKSDFVQSRLTTGDIVRGYSMVNEAVYISKMQQYYLALAAVALLPNSKAAVEYFINNLTVTVSTILGRITSSSNLPIVVQLREIIATLKTDFGNNI